MVYFTHTESTLFSHCDFDFLFFLQFSFFISDFDDEWNLLGLPILHAIYLHYLTWPHNETFGYAIFDMVSAASGSYSMVGKAFIHPFKQHEVEIVLGTQGIVINNRFYPCFLIYKKYPMNYSIF